MNKIKYNWGTKRWEWTRKDGKLLDDKEPIFTVVEVLNELVDELHALQARPAGVLLETTTRADVDKSDGMPYNASNPPPGFKAVPEEAKGDCRGCDLQDDTELCLATDCVDSAVVFRRALP